MATSQGTVGAVVLSHDRRDSVEFVLDRLERLPLDEILLADNGSLDGTLDMARARGGRVRVIELESNRGVAARNIAAQCARSDLLLMLDDDSYPRPGTLEVLREAFRRQPRLGIAGGRIADVDPRGAIVSDGRGLGSFDWFLRPATRTDEPEEGFPASFFPQGGCMVRREAFLQVGGCFEPYWFYGEEIDLTARMIGAGWDVRYFPQAVFEHRREPAGRSSPAIERMLRYRIRNQIWYFCLRFPPALAARRILLYLGFDFVESAYRSALGAWLGGVLDAWRQRAEVAGARQPISRPLLRRVELDRGRKHVRLMWHHLARR